MKKLGIVLAVVCVLAIVPSAIAGSVIAGQPTATGSWTQEFYENGQYYAGPGATDWTQYTFDRWQIEMVVGSLNVPNLSDPSDGLLALAPGWTYTGSTAQASITSPTPVSDLYFDIDFAPDPSQPLEFYNEIFLGNVLEGTQLTTYNMGPIPGLNEYGSNGPWTYYTPVTPPTFGAAPIVPEPVSMIFFGTGLVAVGGYVARRRMQTR